MASKKIANSMSLGSKAHSRALLAARMRAILAAVYVICFWSNPTGEAMMTDDSFSFLSFSRLPAVAGYSIFLDLSTVIFGTVDVVPKVQLVFMSTAVWFLGWSVNRTINAPFFAFLLMLVILCQSALMRLHFYLTTEAMFVPMLCIIFGISTILLTNHSVRLMGMLALFSGLAAATRPAIIIPCIPLIILWIIWDQCIKNRTQMILAIMIPLTC